ncbi:ATP synthase F1 subcomplex epsilon subunit [uncultured Paludibacter sp.]|uniref:ATP synthase F1 subcomplex epsilon subunit n=1 Tax=uncultured Paludibacter sp. TaxID=497635 RepID=A0A653AEC0_9BACT|nr:ATP synthase F1 subcomplex epsilon subunit [uncultured Paludibacter sp.]
MKNICLCFEVHQPLRLKRYRFFEIGQDHYYYDDFQTEERIRQLAEESYLPANKILAEMIRATNGKFKCAFSISGVALEQFEQYAPDVIDSFKELAKTGSVEFLAETYSHSLASIYDANEFEKQVKLHADKIEALFGKKPTAFRNAELIYSDEIGEIVSKLGYKIMLIEEAKHIMGWKSPNNIYTHSYVPKLKLLVRNNKFSDDVSFRFSNRTWSDYPLDAWKYMDWIAKTPENEEIINIWMGYEAIGTFQKAETGIFDFIKALPYHAMENGIGFTTPSEAVKKSEPKDALICPYPISWSGNKDLSVWNGNDLQNEALNKLYAVSERVRMCKDKPLLHDWLILQTTDNFRYMSHTDAYGTNYSSPYEAFINYMNVLADFLDRVEAQYPSTVDNEELNALLKTINNQEKEIATLEEELKKARARKEKKAE